MNRTLRLLPGQPLLAETEDDIRNRWAERLFYIGFLPLLFVLLWKTTAFPQYEKAELLAMAFFTACSALKMLFFDRWSLKEVLFLAASLVIAGLSFYESGFTRPLVIVVAVFGAKDLDGRKLLKIWLLMSALNLLLAMSAGLLGIIENYTFQRDEGQKLTETVYSIGITNTTDCAARIFFTMLVWFYLRGGRLRWFEYLAGFILAFGTYYYTGGRIDSACIAAAALLFLTANMIRNFKKKSARCRMTEKSGKNPVGRISSVIAFLSLPVGAAVSLAASAVYQPGGVWNTIDEWSSHRLSIGKQTFTDYDIKLFGQTIEMQGNGRGGFNRFVENAKYNFIDISYQSVLMLYGLVFFIVVFALYLLTVWRHRKDIYLMLCIMLVAFNCMFAHHLTEIAYIPFIMLAFAGNTEETTWKPMKT